MPNFFSIPKVIYASSYKFMFLQERSSIMRCEYCVMIAFFDANTPPGLHILSRLDLNKPPAFYFKRFVIILIVNSRKSALLCSDRIQLCKSLIVVPWIFLENDEKSCRDCLTPLSQSDICFYLLFKKVSQMEMTC